MEEFKDFQRQTIQPNITEGKKSKKVSRLVIVLVVIVVFVLGTGAGYLVFNRLTEKGVLGKANNPEYVSQIQKKQIENILEDLGELILVTEDEEPTVATILNVEALQKQNPTFYANAKEGDLLIIYSEKAIIFRRDEKKIINVAPVFIESDQTQVEAE